jgi:FkbM family methyltransferase
MQKKNIIFGANNTAKHFLDYNKNIKSNFFIDNDEGIKSFLGKKVYNFSSFIKKKIDVNIIVCSTQFYNIYLQLVKFYKKKNIKFFFSFKKKKQILFNIISYQKDFLMAEKLIKRNSVIIDVGGNVGLFSLFLYLKRKIKFSYIVEPQNNLCKSMIILFKKFKFSKYKIFNYCISSSKKKFLKLFIPRKDNLILSGNSSLIKNFNSGFLVDTLKIRNLNIKVFLNKINKNEIIDFIKIDVEGFELNILKGFKKIINFQKPIIYVEVQKPNFNLFIKLINNDYDFYNIFQIQSGKLLKVKNNYLSMHNFLIRKDLVLPFKL